MNNAALVENYLNKMNEFEKENNMKFNTPENSEENNNS